MSQIWNSISGADKLAQSRQDIVDRTESLKCNFSGTSFPTTNVVQGQFCYRSDLNQLYQCDISSSTQVEWKLIADLNVGMFNKNGDTMAGFLTLWKDPTQALHAATKQYVDAQSALALKKAGDTMAGFLTLSADPTAAMHAATKQYIDNKTIGIGGPLSRTGTIGSGTTISHNTSGVTAQTVGGSGNIPVISVDAYGHIVGIGQASLALSNLLGKYSDTAQDIYNNGWYRSNGSVGWYNQTYGGGIYMFESSTVRVYGGKQFCTDWVTLQSDGRIWTSAYGYLDQRFAPYGVYFNSVGTLDAGTGGVLNPAAFYLQQSGQQVQLVRVQGNCNCNCACTCFPAGTPILMADGSWKGVEEIRAGDLLMTPTGPQAVLEVETPVLGDRKMLAFEDEGAVLHWTDDHAFWTRRDGREGLAVADRSSFMRGVEAGVVRGLPDNDAVLELDDARDEFAHLDGWVRRKVIDITDRYAPDTRVYLPVVGGSHLIIAAGFVMSGGANGFDFDYTAFSWSAVHAPARI